MLLYCCITKFILVMQVYSQDKTGSGMVALCRLENSTSHVKCDGTTALPITKQAEHTDRLLEGRLHFARSWCTLTLSSALNPGLLGEGGENCRWSHFVVCTDFHDRKIGSECRLVYNLIFCWYILRLRVLCCAV